MKILLFGANGQVGDALVRSLQPLGEVVATTRSGRLPDGSACELADFDKADAVRALIESTAPDIVVNAAAYTAVDRAEDEPEAAYRANHETPGIIAAAAAERDALLVHYSTDYVFDGRGGHPYGEDDPVAPLGVYGASKLAGEEAVRVSGCRHVILRTAWVYGWHGANFMRTMLRLAKERDELRVVADQFGTPTPAPLIAAITSQVLARHAGQSGTWHLTARGQTSWHGFAEAIIEEAFAHGLLDRAPRVTAISTREYPTRAARPAWSVLDMSRLQKDFGCELPEWRQALVSVLQASS